MAFIKHIPERETKRCRHPEHNPPGMIVLPPGTHIWRCPHCGATQRVYIPSVTLSKETIA